MHCRLVCLTNRTKVSLTNARSWDSGNGFRIWEVLHATCAAPTYFEPLQKEGQEYIDGSLRASNPTIEALRMVKEVWNIDPDEINLLLSLGTGLRVPEITSKLVHSFNPNE